MDPCLWVWRIFFSPQPLFFFNLNVIVIFIEKNINITLDFTNASCNFETFSKFMS